jgi:anti-anti-sigma regulatory factor
LAIRVNTEKGKRMTIIQIQGKLTRADLRDLKEVCESASTPLWLDLSDLTSADNDGVRELQSLSEAGAELHGANPYICQLLLEANEKKER